jgi:hypothetical protein
LLLAVLFTAAGCEAPTAPGRLDNLVAARARWSAQGAEAYTYEINRSCFCVLGGRRMTVTVQNGAVSGAEYLDSGTAVEAALLTYVPTIPDLFDLIERALEGSPAYFFASYDSGYGYPTRIEIDRSANAIDDEEAISARNLVVTGTRAR